MSLSSALFSGISGLNTLGNAMTVIGDNIANVNTVGFKASRVTFQDVLSQTVATTAGTAQVGRGTSLADITSSFSQGSFESTDSTTDLAIGGEGFFVVRDPSSQENQFYTRSGQFRFDKDGNFVTPAGYIVRGWYLDPDTGEDQGSITDVMLQSFTSSPRTTDQITVITNLDADISSKTTSLSNAWDGTATTQIAATAYEYQSTLKAYDTLGSTHDITIYYDKVSGSDWEYIVTCNPGEDNRTGFDSTTSAGLLARGEIEFSVSSGTVSDLTLETLDATGHEQSVSNQVYGDRLGITSANMTIAIDNHKALTADATGFALKWDGDTSSWFITDNAGYTNAVLVAGGDEDEVKINLDGAGSPTADITIDFATSLTTSVAGSITSFTQTTGQGTTPPTVGAITVNNADEITASGSTTLTRGASSVTEGTHTGAANGNINSFGFVGEGEAETWKDTDATIVLTWTWGGGPGAWSFAAPADDGGYDSASIIGDANSVSVDLGGGAVADITTTFTAALLADATVEFTLTAGTWTASGAASSATVNDTGTALEVDFDGAGAADDISVAYSANRWASGDVITMESLEDNADTLSFDITGSGNWTVDTANTDGFFEFSPDFIGGTGTRMDIEFDIGVWWDGISTFVPDALTTTQFSSASTTVFQSANGYGAGDLQAVMVGTDGAITGQYTNGQIIPLYRVALAKFQNNQGLFKVGGNLFRMTRLSGDPITGKPGTAGLGSLSPNSLEQSNVDIATEFVKMITTQRGFQANSKIITVTDQMLAELIALKR